ncbi:MAG: response regulator [Deltaproteobacteria bacterium]|jgi:signal transduction histidine kinase/DNA-binding response OmpR family regulator
MIEPLNGLRRHVSLSQDQLLVDDEVIAIVDDDAVIREPLKTYFNEQGLPAVEASDAAGLWHLLATRKVALVLLDIGLPATDGLSILPQILENHPDVAVIMLTGVADLKVALECIRAGADDYLSKPVRFNEILFTVRKALEKRRLVFENRKYQEELEEAHFRIQLLHQLSIKMNTVYLSTVELDEILRAILVGITANEGLRFNRAFLAMFNKDRQMLEGRLAIGPRCREVAGQVWAELQEKKLGFLDIMRNIKNNCGGDFEVNQIIQSLRIPVADTDNLLIKAAQERRSIMVTGGEATDPVPPDLIDFLGEDTFVVVPLYSPGRSFGVIIADNFVTGQPIDESYVGALELFASQASLAIEQSHLYTDMQKKIGELEELNHELDINKDLLIKAERYSALGHMAAQMVHVIRNPITSIGGISRLLSKKITAPELGKYLQVMIKETDRLESTLSDLFDFVSHVELSKEPAPLYRLIHKTLMLVQSSLTKQNIVVNLDLPEPEPVLEMDVRQMQQMLLHLFRNAIEAMPNGGALSIVCRGEAERVHISISDTGIGIPEAAITLAKDPFFTTKTYGTGMGLTMVERVVKAHQGDFALHKRDQGLQVDVLLPGRVAGTSSPPQ